MTDPPIIAIEVLSPKQPMSDITDKINNIYLPGGVKSVWIVIPLLQSVTVIVPNMPKITYSEGILKDSGTGIELPLNVIFRNKC